MEVIWKTIERAPNYEINQFGQVRNKTTLLILKQKIDRYGYLTIGLCNNKRKIYPTIHRLLALAFIPNPNNYPQVNHIDGNKLNNNLSNLEWISASGNVLHALDNDLYKNARHVIVKDIKTNKIERYLSLKEFSKKINVYSNVIVPYIKNSEKNPFLNRYIIKIEDISSLKNICNVKIFGRKCYVYDYLTQQWTEYESTNIAAYFTGLRCVSNIFKTDPIILKNIGYVLSSKKYDITDKLNLLDVKNNRKRYLDTPYNPRIKNGYKLYDYKLKKEYEFDNDYRLVDFINKNATNPISVSIFQGIKGKCRTNGKNPLIRGFGLKLSTDTTEWEPKKEKSIILSQHCSSAFYAFKLIYNNDEKIIISKYNLLKHFNVENMNINKFVEKINNNYRIYNVKIDPLENFLY